MWQIPHKERKLLTKGFIELCMFPLVGKGGGTGVPPPLTKKIGLLIFFIDGNDHHDDENNAY